MPPNPFEELQRLASESGVDKSFDFLEQRFRHDKDYFKLFEVLKMRCRNRLGLPIVYSQQPDDLSEEQQRQLEDGLLDACREVGTLFFESGQFQEGWMYLQPVGDKALTEKLFRSIEPDQENADALIDIMVSQGAAPAYGYSLLLKQYGTCDGVTTFDTQAARFDRATQQEMASTLLGHLYEELIDNIKGSIKQHMPAAEESEPSSSLSELMNQHPDLTSDGAHHIDATHLASLMRIARLVTDRSDLERAAELAQYGSQLAKDLQYPGDPPFEDTYVDHALFYRALLGKNVDEAVAHFEKKIENSELAPTGSIPQETMIDFLVRLNRNDEALAVAMTQLLGKHEPLGIAPAAFDIAQTPSSLTRLMEFYQSEDDLLGFAVSLLKRKSMENKSAK